MMALVGVLGALMVSTIRYSSFKTVGTSSRSTRLAVLFIAAIGMLIYLFSEYALLGLIIIYVLHGPILRLGGLFRRKSRQS